LVIPPNELVFWTPIMICLLMLVYWQLDVKHRFRGPPAVPHVSPVAETSINSEVK